MENRNGNNATEAKKARYVKIGTEQVYLNAEQQKAWDKFINDNRNAARRDGSCTNSNYHTCDGDCFNCKYHQQGRVLSTDDEKYVEGNAGTTPRGAHKQPAESSQSAETIALDKIAVAHIFEVADQRETNGARILALRFMNPGKPMSTYEIAEELGMKQTTVNVILNRLLKYIREHRDEFI